MTCQSAFRGFRIHFAPFTKRNNSLMDLATSGMTLADQASTEYLGRWNRLISTTNWEKGRIIHEWRSTLLAADAPLDEYSDEAWARRVGQVSGQHVGRLRRCYERFGETHADYRGLFWSHFQAALDWPDAEMWLEGAVQNDWSVALMRRQRAESYGQVAAAEGETEAVAPTEWDEDAQPAGAIGDLDQSGNGTNSARDSRTRLSSGDSAGPLHDGPDFGDDSESAPFGVADEKAEATDADLTRQKPTSVSRPFAALPTLPDDLTEAFENLKLAVLRHKTTDWQHVQPSEIRAHLAALSQLLEENTA